MIKLSYSAHPPYTLTVTLPGQPERVLPVIRQEMNMEYPTKTHKVELVLSTLYDEFGIKLSEQQLYEFLKNGELEIE